MRYLIIIGCFHLTLGAFAQKCNRPEEVFIELNSLDSTVVSNCLRNPETRRICLQDSSEVFIRTSELKEIRENEYSGIQFQSITQLREKEIEIMRCEANQPDNTVYLDIDINSVFKKIYMVISEEEKIYKFQVKWVDSIE